MVIEFAAEAVLMTLVRKEPCLLFYMYFSYVCKCLVVC